MTAIQYLLNTTEELWNLNNDIYMSPTPQRNGEDSKFDQDCKLNLPPIRHLLSWRANNSKGAMGTIDVNKKEEMRFIF